ncbi:MAG: GIY-YIG nuclease family protein [Actinobacteria bacterium]|nr:GIY-YIG nuclease family protein [Actinomycetota bacterium]
MPRRPGVYLFRDRAGSVLYVGKAANLRSRVRSYFSTDERRKVGALLRDTARIDHKVCPSTLEAAVLESRLIRVLDPRYNTHGTRWRRAPYLRVPRGADPRAATVVRSVRNDGALYLGPLASTRQGRAAAEAIGSAVALRRRAAAATEHRLVEAMTTRPDLLVAPLIARMEAMAGAERFEEAAVARDRAAAIVEVLARQRRLERIHSAERLVIEVDSGELAELRRGVLWQMWPADRRSRPTLAARQVEMQPAAPPDVGAPIDRGVADELACVASWLDAHADSIRLHEIDGTFASSYPDLPDLRPNQAPNLRPAGRR